MDRVTDAPQKQDLFRVEVCLRPGKMIFTSLAHAIRYLIDNQTFIYSLDVIEGDLIHNLVSPEQAEMSVRQPEDGRTDLSRERFTAESRHVFYDANCGYPGDEDNVIHAPFGKPRN